MAGEFVIEYKSNFITADVKEAGHEMEDWLLEHGGEETGREEQYLPNSVFQWCNYTKECMPQSLYGLFPFSP